MLAFGLLFNPCEMILAVHFFCNWVFRSVTDKKSSWILINFQTRKSIYTQKNGLILRLTQWGSVTHQMTVPVPSISCCVLNHIHLFYQIQNALAFNRDKCCHLVLFLQLLPFHWIKRGRVLIKRDKAGEALFGIKGGGGQGSKRGTF
jgi:hypothetical protein